MALITGYAEALCRIFGLTDPASVGLGATAIRLYCAGAMFAGISTLAACYDQSTGMARRAALLNLARGFLLPMPLLFLLSFWGAAQVFLLFPITELLCCLLWVIVAFLAKGNQRLGIDRERIYQRVISNREEGIGGLAAEVEAFCQHWGADARQQYYTMMVVEEVVCVIWEQALHPDQGESIHLTLIADEDHTFQLHIRDNARDFNPFAIQTARLSNEDSPTEGLGMLLVKNKAQEFLYQRREGFNTLTIRV